MEDWLTLPVSRCQKREFGAGGWRGWVRRYPMLFDDVDKRLAIKQAARGYYFYEWLSAVTIYEPGFPFCQPDQGLHTPTRLSARQISSAHVIPLPTPVRWGRARLETDWSPCFQGISQAPLHACALSSPLRCTQAARQPPGTGSAQILRSMSPNSRRVRCPSASRSQ